METNNMEIRLFKQEDAIETAQVIAETLRTSNSKDYSPKYIDDTISSLSADVLIERAKSGHMYVVCDKARIVGCGAIAGYWGSTTESILLTIFVLPEYQGKGIGKALILAIISNLKYSRPEWRLFTLTLQTEFFRSLGFREVPKSLFPEKIWSDCSKCAKRHCCDETALLIESENL